MEDVLDIYKRPYDPRCPQVCVDETSKQLIGETRAVHRQLDHYGYHVGQIVLIARMLAKDKWITLSVPPGGSEEYNRRVWKR